MITTQRRPSWAKHFVLLWAAAITAVASLLLTSVASASCLGPVPMNQAIADSAATFVGTVSGLENDRRWATVDVLEVWKGETRVTSEAMVKAGPEDPPGPGTVVTSVDRHYRLGETYLFVVHGGSGSTFRDNNCSRTTTFSPRLARYRPAAVDPSPVPDASPSPTHLHVGQDHDHGWQVPLFAALIVLAAALLSVGVMLMRDRRRQRAGPSSV